MEISFLDGMKWFLYTAGLIFAPFAITEKFSSEEDLEQYYLLITVNRFKFSAQWYLLLIKFVDLFFGFHKVLGGLVVPSVLRVIVYTVSINMLIIVSIFSLRSVFHAFLYVNITSSWAIM